MTVTTGIRVGRYEVGRELGKGGFGILHVARDVELDREIAIKFLRPEHAFRRDTVQRFLQEARAAARIQHPGIVTVFESGVVEGTATRADGTVYIAMELLAGETLSARLRREGRFAPAAAIAIVRQLASALAAAHAAGIVHRDLTPHNVFLVPDAAVVGGERVKVVDFGIAKLVDGLGANVQTHSLVVLGTPM
ncbi:MAG TPA: serine/threonine-protein kinase, partial [Kofleriaceae bacterium]|nr:serine/threonine-protein kinase [Kofleriaceae bacterium]